MKLSDQSRVWLYLSSREFAEQEVEELNSLVQQFCEQWAAHGVNLAASGEVLHRRVIALLVDEAHAGASGCSIDTSVQFIRDLEMRYSTRLFDRTLVAYLNGESFQAVTLPQAIQLINDGILTEGIPVINTVITSKKELDERLVIPLGESWLARYLKAGSASSGHFFGNALK